MSTTYGKSPGGYIWAVAEPAAGIALLTLIFSLGFRSPPLGNSFALFYASGMLPFLLYMDVTAKVGQTIRFSRKLLEYPRITFLDALLARFILNAITHILVGFIVVGFILYFFSPNTTINYGRFALSFLLALLLAFGIGVLNSFLILALPVWQTIWAVLNRPLFFISCIFFIFDDVPQPYKDILWYNPLVHIVGIARDGVYPFYKPAYISIELVVALSALPLIFGLLLLKSYYRDVLNK